MLEPGKEEAEETTPPEIGKPVAVPSSRKLLLIVSSRAVPSPIALMLGSPLFPALMTTAGEAVLRMVALAVLVLLMGNELLVSMMLVSSTKLLGLLPLTLMLTPVMVGVAARGARTGERWIRLGNP